MIKKINAIFAVFVILFSGCSMFNSDLDNFIVDNTDIVWARGWFVEPDQAKFAVEVTASYIILNEGTHSFSVLLNIANPKNIDYKAEAETAEGNYSGQMKIDVIAPDQARLTFSEFDAKTAFKPRLTFSSAAGNRTFNSYLMPDIFVGAAGFTRLVYNINGAFGSINAPVPPSQTTEGTYPVDASLNAITKDAGNAARYKFLGWTTVRDTDGITGDGFYNMETITAANWYRGNIAQNSVTITKDQVVVLYAIWGFNVSSTDNFNAIGSGGASIDAKPEAPCTMDAAYTLTNSDPIPVSVPKGSSDNPFTGVLEGASKTISLNMTSPFLDSNGHYYQGLFAWVEGNAVIRNFKLRGTMGYNAVPNSQNCIGSAVAYCRGDAVIDRIDSSVAITVSAGGGIPNTAYIGGVVGHLAGNTILRNSAGRGDINSAGAGGQDGLAVGLVAGRAGNAKGIYNCAGSADITITDTAANRGNRGNAGGILGYIETNFVPVINCHSAGTITINNDENGPSPGGILGKSDPVTTITNCYSTMKILVVDSHAPQAGGIVGYIDNDTSVLTKNVGLNSEVTYTNCTIGNVGRAIDARLWNGTVTGNPEHNFGFKDMPINGSPVNDVYVPITGAGSSYYQVNGTNVDLSTTQGEDWWKKPLPDGPAFGISGSTADAEAAQDTAPWVWDRVNKRPVLWFE